jgi:MFS family permease
LIETATFLHFSLRNLHIKLADGDLILIEILSKECTVRYFRLLIFGLIMGSAVGQFELVPVMPVYAHRLGLSGFQQGAVLAATGIAALAVCLPSGTLCDRFGARRMTLLAGWLMTAGMLGQAMCGGFPGLFTSRLVFGAGYGMVWTAGLAWLAAVTPGGSPALGGTVASGGIGGVLGPAVSGVLVQRFGLGLPPLATAVLFVLILAGLLVVKLPAETSQPAAAGRISLRAIFTSRGITWPIAAVVMAGLGNSVCALLVPAELHVDGVSATQTGLHFALAGTVFAIGSAMTAASGRRALRGRVLCAAMLIGAGAFMLTVISTATVALIVMLYITTTARSVLWTVSYPLAAGAAEQDGVGVGTSVGLLNGVWAATAVIGPLAAAVTSAHLGPRGAFALTEIAVLALVAVAIWRTRPALEVAPARVTGNPEAAQPRVVARGR